MVLAFKIFAGLTLSLTQYSKSLDFEYESVNPLTYGMEIEVIYPKEYFAIEMKRLDGTVQSKEGLLNIFGWDYTHDIIKLKYGTFLGSHKRHILFSNITFYYYPILFPQEVGVLSSSAAFEKTFVLGLGLGYKRRLDFKQLGIDLEVSFSYLDFLSSEYDSKYGFLWDTHINPYFKINKFLEIGASYNLVSGMASLKSYKTDQEHPVKTQFFNQNFFLTLKYMIY